MFEYGAPYGAHTVLYCRPAVTPANSITLSWRPTVRMSKNNFQTAQPSSGEPRTKHCRGFSKGVNYKNQLFLPKS